MEKEEEESNKGMENEKRSGRIKRKAYLIMFQNIPDNYLAIIASSHDVLAVWCHQDG